MLTGRQHACSTIAACAMAAFAVAGVPVNHGYDDLKNRLGAATPDGQGIPIAQVEAPDGTGDYGPTQTNNQFNGITFFEQSGPAGASSHAHNVARRFYGNKAIIKGADVVYLYEVNDWLLTGFLRAGSGSQPRPTPGGIKVFSHSWVGTASTTQLNNDALRRADYVMTRDDVLMVVGVNNIGGSNQPLLSHVYNGLAVGLAPPEEHQDGNTMANFDGPGRIKPDIVTTEIVTSYATPYVAAGAVLMTETAREMIARGAADTAERGEVIKAVLMAGAQKTDGWTNNPGTTGVSRGRTFEPIDQTVGVGTLDVNRSHLILTAGEQDGSATVPTAVSASHRGWDLAEVVPSGSVYYRFRLRDEADSIDIVATWHRQVAASFTSWSVADFDLHLWRVDDMDQLHSLSGNDGVGVFDSGNVISESAVDNVEHLHIEGLEACEYVLEVRRTDSSSLDTWDVAVAWMMPEPLTCVADVDRMGDAVDVFDLLDLLAAWGPCNEPCPPSCPADITGDNVVDVFDLLDLLAAWGPCN